MNTAKVRNPWLVAIVVIFASIVFAVDMYKVPPTMGLLLGSVSGMSPELSGWLVSAVFLAGIILALPAGGAMMKTGPRLLGIIALCCTLAGSLMGVFMDSYVSLLVSRIVEGIGIGLIGVIAPAVIAVCFPSEKRGLPMSIWSLWAPLGLLFIFNVATGVVDFAAPTSWKNVWWLTSALLAVALLLWIAVVKVPESEASLPEADEPKASFFDAFKSASAWCLALLLMIFAIGLSCLTTYAPGFIENNLGYTAAEANMYSSIPLVAGMITGSIVIGILLNVLSKYRTTILVISMVATLAGFIFIFEFTSSIMIAFMICGGFVFQLAPATIFTLAPEAALSARTIGPTMGLVIFGQNLGGLGAGIVGTLMASEAFAAVGGYNWHFGTIILVALGIIGVLISIAYGFTNNKMLRERHNTRLYSKRYKSLEEDMA